MTPLVHIPSTNEHDKLNHEHFDDLFLKRYQFNIRNSVNREKELKYEKEKRQKKALKKN